MNDFHKTCLDKVEKHNIHVAKLGIELTRPKRYEFDYNKIKNQEDLDFLIKSILGESSIPLSHNGFDNIKRFLKEVE